MSRKLMLKITYLKNTVIPTCIQISQTISNSISSSLYFPNLNINHL
jgi:hypothetical protein